MYSIDRLMDIITFETFLTGGADYDPCHEDPPLRSRKHAARPLQPRPQTPNSLHDAVAFHIDPPMFWIVFTEGGVEYINNWWELKPSNPARKEQTDER